MKMLFVVSLFIAVAASGVYSQACHLREIDLCMATGVFHYQSNGFPADEERLGEWCEVMVEVQDCMGNFSSKCVSPLQREVIGLMAGAENEARQLCTEGTEIRADFLKHSECMAEAAGSREFRSILKDVQVVVDQMSVVKYKQRFPLLCCGFSRFHIDTDELVKARCGEETAVIMTSLVHMVTTKLPETICQSFDAAGDVCQSLLPARGTPLKGGEKSQLTQLFEMLTGGE